MDSLVGIGLRKSTVTSCQGPSGSVVGHSGSGDSGLATYWQPWQRLQFFSTSFSKPGHHTLVRRVCLVPMIPKCPSWVSATAVGLNFYGNTMRLPRRIRYPMEHSSPATAQYFLYGHLSQFPLWIHSRTADSSLSSWCFLNFLSGEGWWHRRHGNKPNIICRQLPQVTLAWALICHEPG